jgi:hypothetical protein
MIRNVLRSIVAELGGLVAALEGSYADACGLMVFLYRRIAEDRAARETLRFLVA